LTQVPKPVKKRGATRVTPAERGELTSRQRLAGWLEQRFLVRFHVALILAVSFAAGLLATRLFLQLGLETMHWRWPLALLAAYGAFLLALRLWLSYVGLGRYLERETSLDIDITDLEFSGGGGSSGSGSAGSGLFDWAGEAIGKAGGGRFGGAGASGDFSSLVGSDAGASSGGGSGLGLPEFDLPDLGDDGVVPLVILGLILALLLAVFGVGVYLIWQAPLLLAEVAFEAAMAAGLVRSVRKVGDPGWVGGALSASWKPFALILVLSISAAVLAEKFAPEARTLPQAVHQLLG
jgi:hypothetical protein